jgi:nucleotidyltransferase substrate binding protein (TIGR01987 family)
MEMIGAVYITPLLKAFKTFERFRLHDKTEQERAGIIQAFEYCFELAWKTMKRLLEDRGLQANSPRETFRMAALEGWIEDPELWFDFIKKRNMTTHTYNLDQADAVIAICPAFSRALQSFLRHIGIESKRYDSRSS